MRLLLLPLLLCSLAPAAPDTGPLEAWLDRQPEIRTLEAEFVQERTLPALKKPVRSTGTLRMQRPSKLRWELGEPPKTIAVSDGDTMTLVDVEQQVAQRLPSDSRRARQFTLLTDKALTGGLDSFTKAFEPIESRVTNGIYQLTLRPRDRSMRNKAPWLFLDIDPRSNELRAIEVRLEDESRIRTIFTRTSFNQALPADTFRVDLSGYKVR